MAGNLRLIAASPASPYIEVFTVGEVEHFLGLAALSPADDERDALLESLIVAAREFAESLQGRDLVEKQYEKTLDSFESTEILLRDPLLTVDLVEYRDSDGDWTPLVENTDYIVDTAKQPGLIRPPYAGSWPSFTAWPTSAVLIRFTSGYATDDPFWSDAGQRVLIGMKLLIADWYSNRLPRALSAEDIPAAIKSLLSHGAVPRFL